MTDNGKLVTVELRVKLVVEVPDDWDQDMVEFHENESSYCLNNHLDQINGICEESHRRNKANDLRLGERCICFASEVKFLQYGADKDAFDTRIESLTSEGGI